MIFFPNAKINIGLHITGKRNDGYHNIESCFYPVAWSDILEVVESDTLSLKTTGIEIPGKWEDNLCIKAFNILKEAYQIPPVSFHLHKIVPIGAGLGGGSADGSFALKALNELFELQIENDQLEQFALQIGSDCPFFIKNQPIFVKGRGEVFEEMPLSLEGKIILMVNPPIHVSTGEAYSGIREYSEADSLKNSLLGPIENWKGIVKNDFEASVFTKYPEIADIKEILYNNGATYTSMTGSGASVFGIFDERMDYKHWFPAEYMVWQGEMR
jgi:4-diphosphocytidyl-2-C-methyl-D-erythritol kinase